MNILIIHVQDDALNYTIDPSNMVASLNKLHMFDKLYVKNNMYGFELIYEKMNGDINTRTINSLLFDFAYIKDIATNYDYLAYFNDTWTCIHPDECIKISVDILNQTSLFDQVIFGKLEENVEQENITLNKINLSLPVKNSSGFNVLENDWRVFESMKQIFVDKKNPNKKDKPESDNYNNLNYGECAKKSFKNILNFRLVPSLIKTSFLRLMDKNICLKICHYYEHAYSLELENDNFKTCYLNFDLKKVLCQIIINQPLVNAANIHRIQPRKCNNVVNSILPNNTQDISRCGACVNSQP